MAQQTAVEYLIEKLYTEYRFEFSGTIVDRAKQMEKEQITTKVMKKPIHKFNGGLGATLCHKCSKIITEGFVDDLYCETHGGKRKYKYKLIRENDGYIVEGNLAYWVEWDDEKRGRSSHEEIQVGYSLIVDPILGNYRWLTTKVTEIEERRKDYIKFKTKNSTYELHIG